MGDRVEITVGPALQSSQAPGGVEIGQRPRFEYVFIDADKENNWAYMDKAIDISMPGTLIVVDNVIRRANIVNPEKITEGPVAGAPEVIDNAAKDARVEGR